MRSHTPVLFALLLAALCVLASNGALPIAKAVAQDASQASAAALVAEVRRSFTIDGKPIPPEIFRDFGDGDMADSGAIWVTIDAAAAIGSNLYYDEIKQDGSTVSQTKRGPNNIYLEKTDYSFCGTTDNGLIVILASYNGGGSGIFETLHIVDVAAARSIDINGEVYQRINLTNVRSVILGDRWDGDIKINKNDIAIITTKTGPADDKGRPPVTITATRP